MGGALLAQMGGMLAVQTLAFAAAALLAPGLAGQPVFLWTISLVSAYGVGFPLFCLVIRTLPAAPAPERRTPLAPVRPVPGVPDLHGRPFTCPTTPPWP